MKICARVLVAAVAATMAGCGVVSSVRGGGFELLVTQTPPGPNNNDPSTWGGVQAFDFTGVGAVPTVGVGIPKTSLSDPAGLVYDSLNGQLYVGNRTGNNQPSSVINGFAHTPGGGFVASGSYTGVGVTGIHQLAINPAQNELYAATLNGGIAEFSISGNTLTNNGTLSSGAVRGVALTPDGTHLYATTGSNTLEEFDLVNHTQFNFNPPGSSGLHYLRFLGSELFQADIGAGEVFVAAIDVNDNPHQNSVFSATNAISIAFSPDGTEAFVASQFSGIIREFTNGGSGWTQTGSFDTGSSSLGDLIILPIATPEPMSLGVLGVGVMALLGRRRK